ncbi:2OG-Fe(II) oxygenase, partial [Pseudomonas aeruginosa]
FMSAGSEHEVLPASRVRLSLTGWFRRRYVSLLQLS